MERKLENELPVEGKRYRRITLDPTMNYLRGYTYESEETNKINSILWQDRELFSKSFVEVIEESKPTERKLHKDEAPLEGNKYKYIGKGCDVFTFGKIYLSEGKYCLTSDTGNKQSKWYAPDFSRNFVEVVEEKQDDKIHKLNWELLDNPNLLSIEDNEDQKIGSVNHDKPWYEQVEEEVRKELSNKSLTLHDIDLIGKDVENKINEKIGVKHDQNKLPLFTIIFKQFPLAIQAVAKRALAGHNKYIETDVDWQNFARAGEQDPDRYKNAGLRHLLEEGEDKEEGMEGTTHEAAVVWNFLADLECKLRRENGESI